MTTGVIMTTRSVGAVPERRIARRKQPLGAPLIAFVALIAAGLAVTLSAPASGSVDGQPVVGRAKAVYLFSDASRTVQCALASPSDDGSDSLRCDTVGTPAFTAPPKPSDCPLEWGNAVSLDPYGLPSFSCVGDSLFNENQLAPGTVVEQGAYSCTILSPGVRCYQTYSDHGFELALDHYTPLRPAAKNLLSAKGLGKLKLGMTYMKARRTGYLSKSQPCGYPELKRKYRGYVQWSKGRLNEVSAFPGTNLATTRGVGPGATVGEMKQKHAGVRGPFVTATLSDNGQVWVYLQRNKRGVLVFVIDNPRGNGTSTNPGDLDLVRSMFASRTWAPRKGLASGC